MKLPLTRNIHGRQQTVSQFQLQIIIGNRAIVIEAWRNVILFNRVLKKKCKSDIINLNLYVKKKLHYHVKIILARNDHPTGFLPLPSTDKKVTKIITPE